MSEDIELEIPILLLRWKVNTQFNSNPRTQIHSSEFTFQGEQWFFYYFYHNDVFGHRLGLQKKSKGRHVSFEFSVRVEVGGTGRIVTERRKKRFSEYETWLRIWTKLQADILKADPEFCLNKHELRFLVELKRIDVLGDKSWTLQTDDTEESPPAASNFDQNMAACLQSLSQDFSKMLDKGSDPDVEFQCAGYSTRAHGTVVSARSEVIASMLASDMIEGKTRVVKIPDIDPDIFKHFLRYIYSGQLPDLTMDLALSLYEAGDQYAVLGLAKRCAEFLVEHLSSENACRILVVADAHSDQDFKKSVIGFMLDKDIPLCGKDWPDFCDTHSKLATEVLNRLCVRLSQL